MQKPSDRLTPALGTVTLLLLLAGLWLSLTAPPDVNQGALVRLDVRACADRLAQLSGVRRHRACLACCIW